MNPCAIVEQLDVFKDRPSRLIPCLEVLVVDDFVLQRAEEALHHGVVVAVAFAAMLRSIAKRESS